MNVNPALRPSSKPAPDTYGADPELGFGRSRNAKETRTLIEGVVEAGRSLYRGAVAYATGLKIPAWKSRAQAPLLPTTRQEGAKLYKASARPRKDDVV